jgi:hypothetical protein
MISSDFSQAYLKEAKRAANFLNSSCSKICLIFFLRLLKFEARSFWKKIKEGGQKSDLITSSKIYI